jgi:NADPH:quinone reductase-like Zn-dependent oxidoreductase
LLITGALGSVGRTAVHVAKTHGAHVIAAVRAKQRSEAAKLGADEILALDDQKELDSLKELDAVADTIGHEVIDGLLPHLKKSGILATVVGKPESAKGRPDLKVNEVYSQPDGKRLEQLAREIAQGAFTIPIARTLKLAEIRQAHELAEKGVNGKILLTP